MPSFAAVVLAASSKSTTSSGSDAASLLILVLLVGVAYFLFIRPRSMAARRQRETLQELDPGDEIMTSAGIFGTVLDVESDRVTIETAPGTRLTVLRTAIARRSTPATDEDEATAWPPASQNGAATGEDGSGATADDGGDDHAEGENTESGSGDQTQGGVG